MNQLKGIHHITAITSSAEKIYQYFTDILGLRLVKKTVNQDDIDTYHLFFADDIGSPGTDMTFFDFRGIQKGEKGSDEISRIGFRVKSNQAIQYWKKRFEHYNIDFKEVQMFDRIMLWFEDFDGQEYAIVSDELIKGTDGGIAWKKGPVPDEYGIIGLGPIFLRISNLPRMDHTLVEYLGFEFKLSYKNYSLYEVYKGGNGASVIIDHQPKLKRAYPGYGSVHHMAFRIEDLEVLNHWIKKLNSIGARHSGYVDRFYFKSLYTRLYPSILFEFATEGPGFIDDEESYENLGENLALPPKFRNQRTEIEKIVRYIDTRPKNYDKEYF
ncbi:ring-cleaving dioxygenase [Hujiaoplasma nucleasis]|uniref:Ring-cleaving dioxygenase n=1 Tax=Hujiaoplasma nucleasis TaxID=2725268 RepID=A0A7L6N5U8_9MOLU|nr:VOC family protein [Hujiaoplasma nucleasis]QLY40872.1 ring-cleaving dioxygenase [Hujiaoplasma nucleasis]